MIACLCLCPACVRLLVTTQTPEFTLCTPSCAIAQSDGFAVAWEQNDSSRKDKEEQQEQEEEEEQEQEQEE